MHPTLAAKASTWKRRRSADDTTVTLTIPVGMRELFLPGLAGPPTDTQIALTALRLP
jgi:hypothetical protein